MVGRKQQLDYSRIAEVISQNKEKLICDNKLISRTNKIWMELGNTLDTKSTALYAYVSNNKNNVISEILNVEQRTCQDDLNDNQIQETDTSLNSIDESMKEDEISVYISKRELDDILQTHTYKR